MFVNVQAPNESEQTTRPNAAQCCSFDLAILLFFLPKLNTMKKVGIIACCLLAFIFIQCSSGRSESTSVSDDNTTVTISETETTYILEASFNEEKATAIYQYINSSIKPNAQFAFEDGDVDTRTSLDDGTTLHIKADRGELKVTFDKKTNSNESYERVKQLYKGIKKVIK